MPIATTIADGRAEFMGVYGTIIIGLYPCIILKETSLNSSVFSLVDIDNQSKYILMSRARRHDRETLRKQYSVTYLSEFMNLSVKLQNQT